MKPGSIPFLIISCLIAGFVSSCNTDNAKSKLKLEPLHIYFENAAFDKLKVFRDTALAHGVLERSKDDYVPARIVYRNDSIQAKARLKGDWVDHLKDNKWSFRIKLKDSLSDGLKTFSIQTPKSRNHLDGYLYHKLLKREGILSNELRFVEVFVNDTSWGIYHLEEHLAERMMQSQGKPKGVILKYEDHDYFAFSRQKKYTIGLIRKAPVKIYGTAKKDKIYKNAVKRAKQIMTNYQEQVDTMYHDFDARLMGKYYALCDLSSAYHAMGWINIRFYYNFKTEKMEPVGYDPYPAMEWGKPYLGADKTKYQESGYGTKNIIYYALSDSAIRQAYFKTLNAITDSLYISKFMEEEADFIDFYENEIQRWYPKYSFNRNWLFDNARAIRKAMTQNDHLSM